LISILICVAIYYFKDLSIALGQTEKISLGLSVWMPVLIIGLFCSIGVIQINEK
jgi:lipopolysaccharide export LptBFGC system permease protein LptF